MEGIVVRGKDKLGKVCLLLQCLIKKTLPPQKSVKKTGLARRVIMMEFVIIKIKRKFLNLI